MVSISEEVASLFEAQRRLTRGRPFPSLAERKRRLDALEKAIRRHRAAIDAAVYADFRKSPVETALTETILTLAEIKHAGAALETWMRPQRAASSLSMFGSRAEVRFEPKGVALILSPWNYPFQLALSPLAGALAAGNRCILRPSEKAPHTRAAIAKLVAEAFRPDEVAVVGGEVETAQALLELPFDHVFFTGSTQVGKLVMHAAARHLASVTLELGGKCPAIVAPDADLSWAAKRTAWGKFLNAGQTCIAPDYVLVHESVARRFIAKTVESVAAMYGRTAEERARTPDFCRMIDDAHFERVSGLLNQGLKAGAIVEIGGTTDSAQRYIAPTVLSNVSLDSPLMQEEIFGPILPVLTYGALAGALQAINARDKPLALYAFSRSDRVLAQILQSTPAGGTVQNDTLVQWVHPNLPAGGAGASGMGSYHGRFGFEAFSNRRSVVRQSKFSFAPLVSPPYTRTTRALLGVLEKLS